MKAVDRFFIETESEHLLESIHSTPEHFLVSAVVQRAFQDLYDSSPEVRRDAQKFFDSVYFKPFTFLWCCQALGVDYKLVVKRIKDSGAWEGQGQKPWLNRF